MANGDRRNKGGSLPINSDQDKFLVDKLVVQDIIQPTFDLSFYLMGKVENIGDMLHTSRHQNGANHENNRHRGHSVSDNDPGSPTKWGYGIWGDEVDSVGTITKISTDEGVEGHMLGGDKATMEGVIKPLILGETRCTRADLALDGPDVHFSHRPSESEMGLVDCALWDLLGNKAGVPVYQLLGGRGIRSEPMPVPSRT